jgi:hypothetical protein
MLDGVELPEVAAWDVDKGRSSFGALAGPITFILDQHGTPTFDHLAGNVEVRWSKESAA